MTNISLEIPTRHVFALILSFPHSSAESYKFLHFRFLSSSPVKVAAVAVPRAPAPLYVLQRRAGLEI